MNENDLCVLLGLFNDSLVGHLLTHFAIPFPLNIAHYLVDFRWHYDGGHLLTYT